jgi:hypothetical protein
MDGSAGSGGALNMGGSNANGGSVGASGSSESIPTCSPGTGGAGGGPTVSETCFPWPLDPWPLDAGGPPDGGGCPTDSVQTLAIFESYGCPKGWEPTTIVCALPETPMLCCYMGNDSVCGPGGRYYVVDHRAVLSAPMLAEEGGWTRGTQPCVDGLTAEERDVLAAAWTEAALFEHASVASFSRVSLELLAAGAPSELVELAHRAALDEVHHAQLCFTLASAYAGEDTAPGPFPLGKRGSPADEPGRDRGQHGLGGMHR